MRVGPRAYFTLRDGMLKIDGGAPERVDCHLSVDRVDYLLIGFGRKAQWGPIAKGKVLAWGRRPWLAMRLSRLLHPV